MIEWWHAEHILRRACSRVCEATAAGIEPDLDAIEAWACAEWRESSTPLLTADIIAAEALKKLEAA